MQRANLGVASLLAIGAGSATVGAGGVTRQPWLWLGLLLLLAGCTGWLARERSLAAALADHARVAGLATTDQLTGLLNRHGLQVAVEPLLSTAQRLRQPVTVWFADIDGLKRTNDEAGHAAGDNLIRAVAHALVRSARRGDIVARVGGDEFTVIGLGACTDPDAIATRVQANMEPSVLAARATACDAPVVSVGVAFGLLTDEVTLAELTRRADHDLYGRRQQRRGTTTSHQESSASIRMRPPG